MDIELTNAERAWLIIFINSFENQKGVRLFKFALGYSNYTKIPADFREIAIVSTMLDILWHKQMFPDEATKNICEQIKKKIDEIKYSY